MSEGEVYEKKNSDKRSIRMRGTATEIKKVANIDPLSLSNRLYAGPKASAAAVPQLQLRKAKGFIPRRPDATFKAREVSGGRKVLSARHSETKKEDQTSAPLSARDKYESPLLSNRLCRKKAPRTYAFVEDQDQLTSPKNNPEVAAASRPSQGNIHSVHVKPSRETLLKHATAFQTFTEKIEEHIQRANIAIHKDSFLYLVPSNENPYNLMVVSHRDIDPNNYYTLSKAGITHFQGDNGTVSSEFTHLEQFEREHYIFSLLSQLPFFQKYKKWKKFIQWKQNVRQRKFRQCKMRLQHDLLLFHPHLREPLLSLRKLCYDVTRLKLYHFDARQTMDLDTLCATQVAQKKEIKIKLEEFNHQVKTITHAACETFLANYLIENGFASQATDATDKSKPVTYTERAAMRTQCRKIAKFIRVVDFVVVTSLLQLGVVSIEAFVEGIKKESQAEGQLNTRGLLKRDDMGKALFEVKIRLQDGGDSSENLRLKFNPEDEEFRARIEGAIYSGIKVISIREQLYNQPLFQSYVQSSIEEVYSPSSGGDLELMIVENDQFQVNIEDMNICLGEAFVRAYESTQALASYLQKYRENEAFISQSSVEKFYDASIDTLRDLLTDFTNQEEEFKSLPDTIDVGILRVDARDVTSLIKPSPSKCLTIFHQIIPALASKKNAALLDEYSHASDQLSKEPGCVEAYTSILMFQREFEMKIPDLEGRFSFMRELYGITDEFQIDLSDIEKSNILMLGQARTQVKNAMVALEENSDASIQRFQKELLASLPILKSRIGIVLEQLKQNMLNSADSDVSDVLNYLAGIESEVTDIDEMAKKVHSHTEILNAAHEGSKNGNENILEDEQLLELKSEFKGQRDLWEATKEIKGLSDAWKKTILSELDTVGVDEQLQRFSKLVIRLEHVLGNSYVLERLKDLILELKCIVPMVENLKCDTLTESHWDTISSVINVSPDMLETLTLKALISLNVAYAAPLVKKVSVEAKHEASLLETLDSIGAAWSNCEFEVKQYKESRDTYVLGSVDDIVTHLDDSMVTINSVLCSRYVTPIIDTVQEMHMRLVLFQQTLDEWLACQRDWMYLEPIFGAPDIQRQLPTEAKLFSMVDAAWKDIMKRTHDSPNCLRVGTTPGLVEAFRKHNVSLDKIQKRLEDYLETKRAAFPRFYFLSNDELLAILAQAKNPAAVVPHLSKCFDALVSLEFGQSTSTTGAGSGNVDILAMISPEGERVPLGRNLKARGNVEDWLLALQSSMELSVHKLMKAALLDYREDRRNEWLVEHPGQCVAAVAQMIWARQCEECLQDYGHDENHPLQPWYAQILVQLSDLTELVRSELTPLQRKVVIALITTDVHARDIVLELIAKNVEDTSNFSWQQQLRYYWNVESDDAVIQQSNSSITYGYEYMGATSRLVITPLTDRCWMTITGSFDLKLGTSPAGPAGTGKTESSKDLAKAIGIQCIVFNCSEQIDYKMMGKLFMGLAQCGCWTCLDEFNRIDIEVLSVIAQQLTVLRHGRLTNQECIVFEGQQMMLQDHHVIVTMNPGYAGRTELPDNLKVCFRPVSMMVPDYALIAEIMLFAEGFSGAKELSQKMTRLYKLCSEQLSQQPHYDFGMRAVKSVLTMAGSLKRKQPSLGEELVLIQAMQDANVPKFLESDLQLFHAIVGDLFPGQKSQEKQAGPLRHEIERQLQLHELQCEPEFVKKIVQLYETFNVRFGVVETGLTGSGKTTCQKILKASMNALADTCTNDFVRVKSRALNPKSISMGELYGEINSFTHEWEDGLASNIMREFVAESSTSQSPSIKWTIFDGPIDALWIENMNTVLDDNMTLCLANGERIKLKSDMRMLFEVQDLAVASPATVSRLGVVYLTCDTLGWRAFARSWIEQKLKSTFVEEVKERVWFMFDTLITPGLAFVRQQCAEPMETVNLNLVTSLCNLLEASLPSGSLLKSFSSQSFEQQYEALEKIFIFCYVWSIGASIEPEKHSEFDCFFRDLLIDLEFDTRLPSQGGGTLYESYYNSAKATYEPWSSLVSSFDYRPETPFFKMVVPTEDTVRYSHIMELLMINMQPTFLSGMTGTGKTVLIHSLLQRAEQGLKNEQGDKAMLHQVMPVFINFSAQSSSKVIQSLIEAKFEKKRKALLGPPGKKHAVIFVDDVNLPMMEEYGAQPPIELLRQYLDFKGFYDREKHFWKTISNTVLICAAAPPGGGRSELSPRFMRHFNVLCMPEAGHSSISGIFRSIVDGFLKHAKFTSMITKMSSFLVESTIEVYNRVREGLLPTPAKCHYTFNLRDVSKVFQGILMIQRQQCAQPEVMVHLWIHECMRVFYDRLVCDEDKTWFLDMILSVSGKSLSKDDILGSDDNNPVLFASFLRPGAAARVYEAAPSMAKIESVMNSYLEQYNFSKGQPMKLVFFTDAIKHICRIARILTQPRGNAMIVGVGGSGKRSLTRLGSFIVGHECREIELTRGYDLQEFREDLKSMMIASGVNGAKLTFLFADTQIVNERFLEDINSVLNSGSVPNLFTSDEHEKVIVDLRDALKDDEVFSAMEDSRQLYENEFIARVRNNMHIVLSMSPVGNTFRKRCRKFPSLINCTTIDWFSTWPSSALKCVSRKFLQDIGATDTLRESLGDMCVLVHESVSVTSIEYFEKERRRVYTTPKSYLDLIKLYTSLLAEKRREMDRQIERLLGGVVKLEDTNDTVSKLKTELTSLQPILAQKAKEAGEMLRQVDIDQKEASVVKERVAQDEAIVKQQAENISEIQAEAQVELDKALPILEDAERALDSLDKKDITEVRSFTKPPAAVQMVMEAVCIMLGEKPDWDASKRLLGRVSFMQDLKDYDKDNISSGILKKILKYIENPDMAVEEVRKVSRAATSLCMWVHAMHVYSKVARDVGPKRERVEQLNQELSIANEKLQKKQSELNRVVAKVAELQTKCDAAVSEKNRLTNEAEITRLRLIRAEKLTAGLSNERVRWKDSVSTLSEESILLVGDVLLSAACISYFGPFTGTFRDQLSARWQYAARKEFEIPCREHFNFSMLCSKPNQVREWQGNALPTDKVSTENAILVARNNRWPLLIDPQLQAVGWIKKSYPIDKLEHIQQSDPHMVQAMENCIRMGKCLLIDGIGEDLNPTLDPVLQKMTFEHGDDVLIRIGNKDIPYHDDFRLFLCTKLSHPHFLPDICIKVNIINFTVTHDGLEDQLLGTVVKKERPDIEKRKDKLVSSIANDERMLLSIEERVLSILSEATGNILDDEELISTLAQSTVTSKIILERLAESEVTNQEIQEVRDEYRSVATRGSILFFIIADLARVDPMYQYSLSYFHRLFENCIDDSEPSQVLAERTTNLLDYITATVFKNVSRGLFETHKLLFSFLICVGILRNTKEISSADWNALHSMSNTTGVTYTSDQEKKPIGVSSNQWGMACVLSRATSSLESLIPSLAKDWDAWENWTTTENPFRSPLPGDWESNVSRFQKFLLIRSLCEEKILLSTEDFISHHVGDSFTKTTAALDIHELYFNLACRTPCVFILSSGADPTAIVHRLASEYGFNERLGLISLGQGQGPRAEELIKQAMRTGDWVLLQNCHLAKSWMQDLEAICTDLLRRESFNESDAQLKDSDISLCVHETFRLFVTSFPADYFPVSILQSSVKVTNEPPRGIKANLLRAYDMFVTEEYLEDCVKGDSWQKCIFGLCFFHAVVQERRKFGPLGWNIVYKFSDSDLETALSVLKSFLSAHEDIPWDALHYVTGEINYGGRITDEWDRRCLMAILKKFYSSSLLETDQHGETYKFSDSGVYLVPKATTLSEFQGYFEQLPSYDSPDLFGLHENALVQFQKQETKKLIETVLILQPKETNSLEGTDHTANSKGVVGDDELILKMVLDMESSLPDLLDESSAGDKTFVLTANDHMDSLGTVLSQEILKFNSLLICMEKSLKELARAIRGLVAMSQDLDSMYSSFLINKVPKLWTAIGFASLKPLASWNQDLNGRIIFLRKWLEDGPPPSYPLPVFFFPQGFLTGVLQNYARKHQLPINKLDFDFDVLSSSMDTGEIADGPVDGVYVHGMYLHGASWDSHRGQLTDAQPGEMFSPMPIIHFLPRSSILDSPEKKVYSCPVYKTTERRGILSTTGLSTNFVVSVNLPSLKAPDHWILHGTAIICSLDD